MQVDIKSAEERAPTHAKAQTTEEDNNYEDRDTFDPSSIAGADLDLIDLEYYSNKDENLKVEEDETKK